jgi:hypothetical protein
MDRMQAPPRNAFVGGLADFLAAGTSPQRTQQMRGLMEFLQVPDIAQTLDRVSYGEPLTTGAGMTTKLRPEAENALMAALGMLPAGRPAEAGAMALGRAGERMAERVVPQVMERGGLPAEMLSAMAQGTVSPATVFHGSPHRFTKFDSSKIGTGEGNQTYGYGLYLAENPAVANDYKRQLSSEFFWRDLDAALPTALKGKAPDWTDALLSGKTVDDLASTLKRPWEKSLLQQNKAKIESVIDAHKASGNVYQVDLPDEQIAKMLDYDKPLSKQPKSVQEAIKASGIFKEYKANLSDFSSPMMSRNKNMRGENIMEFLEFKLGGPEQVAAKLRELGISGVRYLDQGSRGAGKGTSNFVVFPGMEDMLRIDQINEQPINSLLQTLGR